MVFHYVCIAFSLLPHLALIPCLSCYKHCRTDSSIRVLISFCLGTFPGGGWLDHVVHLFWDWWANLHAVVLDGYITFYSHQHCIWVFVVFGYHILANTYCCVFFFFSFLNASHFNLDEVKFHCGFYLHFPNGCVPEQFWCLCWPFSISYFQT